MAFDWSSLIEPAVNTGISLYDMYNKSQISGNMMGAAVSPAVDAFGADERQYYQDKMRALESDPSSIVNTPGYKFSQSQGEKAVNREAAKSGHFRGTNRLYDLAEFNQGLASKTYDTQMDRYAQLSGSQHAPDAGAFQKLYSEGAGMDASKGKQAKDAWGGILKDFSEALGGDSSGGTSDGGTSDGAASDGPGLGDAAGAASDLAPEYEAAAALSPEALERAQALGEYSEAGGNADLGGAAMGDLFANNALYSDALANSRTSDIMGETFGTTQSDFGVGSMSTAGTGMAAGGGVLGGMLATKLTGSTGGGVQATNAIGGAAGSMAGGAAAGAMGMTAGGASMGAAAGGAMAGPAIPLALAMMAYGGYSEHQAERKAIKESVGKLFGNTSSELTTYDNPTTNPFATTSNPEADKLFNQYAGVDYGGFGSGIAGGGATQGHEWTSPTGEQYFIGDADYQSFANGQGPIGREFGLYNKAGEYQGNWDNRTAEFRGGDVYENARREQTLMDFGRGPNAYGGGDGGSVNRGDTYTPTTLQAGNDRDTMLESQGKKKAATGYIRPDDRTAASGMATTQKGVLEATAKKESAALAKWEASPFRKQMSGGSGSWADTAAAKSGNFSAPGILSTQGWQRKQENAR